MAIDKELWLSNPDQNAVILVEITAASPTTKVETKFHLSSRDYTSGNTAYDPRITAGPTLKRGLGSGFTGKASIATGTIVIANDDGRYDHLFLWATAGRKITVRIGDIHWDISEFITLTETRIKEITSKSSSELHITLYDELEDLNVPIQAATYTEGPAKDKLIPLCFGQVSNITPVLIDAQILEYQVHDGPIDAITAVYDRGVALPNSGSTCTLVGGRDTVETYSTLNSPLFAGSGPGIRRLLVSIDGVDAIPIYVDPEQFYNHGAKEYEFIAMLNYYTSGKAIWTLPQASNGYVLQCTSLTTGKASTVILDSGGAGYAP